MRSLTPHPSSRGGASSSSPKRSLLAGLAVVGALLGGTLSATGTVNAADPEKAEHGIGHSPSSKPGNAPSGAATTTNTIDDSHEVGAPGAIVSATESASLRTHDKDSNGKISAAEAAKDPGLKDAFAKLDMNKDGSLDGAEFKKYQLKDSAVTGHAPLEPAPKTSP
jgi:hypothetical protein